MIGDSWPVFVMVNLCDGVRPSAVPPGDLAAVRPHRRLALIVAPPTAGAPIA